MITWIVANAIPPPIIPFSLCQIRWQYRAAKHLSVLTVVGQRLARAQGDVATLMRVTPGMVVRLVDHLEQRELLHRRQDPVNRRRHILTVTTAGTKVLATSAAFAATLDTQQVLVSGGGCPCVVAADGVAGAAGGTQIFAVQWWSTVTERPHMIHCPRTRIPVADEWI